MSFHVDLLPAAAGVIAEIFKEDDPDVALRNTLCWVSPPKRRKEAGPGLVEDEFGVVWTLDPRNRGHVARHPWPERIPAEIPLPPPLSSDEAKIVSERASSRPGYVVVWVGDLFERAHFLRGLEGILTDFYLDPDGVDRLFEALTDRILSTMYALRDAPCEAFFLSDDYGAQNSLLMSPGVWRRFLAGRIERLADRAHALGRAFFLHSCGCVREIAADLAGLGVDVLHPVQPECQDVIEIRRITDGRLTLYGGVGTQDTMRSGSPADVAARARRAAEELGREGRFILAPAISLMEDVPLENILAFLRVAWELAGETRGLG